MTVTGADRGMTGRSVWGPLGGDFGLRLASALVLFGIALLVVWQGGWLFAAWIVLACALMVWEWERMTQLSPSVVGMGVALAGIVAATALATLGHEMVALAAAGGGALAALAYGVMSQRRWGWAAVLPLYLGVPAVALVWLRAAPDGWVTTLWFLFVIWATDSFAMIAGRLIGGPLLAPLISPKKTWAGFFGGIAGGIAIGSAFIAIVPERAPTLALIGVMALLAVVAQAGDVAESAVKRHFAMKDAGVAIPGHGGMLDRMDGLLTAVLALALIRLVAPGFPFGGV